jgi:hypothetical protein
MLEIRLIVMSCMCRTQHPGMALVALGMLLKLAIYGRFMLPQIGRLKAVRTGPLVGGCSTKTCALSHMRCGNRHLLVKEALQKIQLNRQGLRPRRISITFCVLSCANSLVIVVNNRGRRATRHYSPGLPPCR